MRYTRYLFLLALLFPVVSFAQQASISGRIADSNGATIRQATIHIEEVGGGASATTSSNDVGDYSFPRLTAADYLLRVEESGFATAEKRVTVLVGQTLSVDWTLAVASVSTTVAVDSNNVEVATTASEVSGNVNRRQMTDLPLNGRNWLELGLLLPGISRNDVSTNTLFNGADTGVFQFNVDGQQVGEDIASSGVGQPRYSRDALSEFQIVTNRFDATQGRSSGAQINAETKSGSNALHATAFGYFRNNVLNAADPVAHYVLPYSDQQFGATAGGPVRSNRLWYFGSYEGELQPYTFFTTPTGFGGTSYSIPTKNTTNIYLGRFDYQPSDRNHLSLRVNGFLFSSPFTGITGTQHPSQAGKNSLKNFSTNFDWSRTYSSDVVNDLKVAFNFFVYSNLPEVLSQEYRFGNVTVGGNYNYPSPHDQSTWQIRDGLFVLRGKQSIKLGAEYLNTYYYGQYPQYSRGAVTAFSSVPTNLEPWFPTWNDPTTWNIAAIGNVADTYVQGFGNFAIHVERNSIGLWVQDDWKVLPRLTLNLGLRYDNDLGLLGNGPYLKSGLETPHSGGNSDIQPRVGFAWELPGSNKTVLRGGVGLYFADLQANQFYDQQLFNGQTTIDASVDATPDSPINLTDPFAPYTGAQFVAGTAPLPKQAVQLNAPDISTPYSIQVSGGVTHTFGKNWTVGADYVHSSTHHDWIRTDQNLSYNPATGFNVNPNTGGRPNASFTSILRFNTPGDATSRYNALLIDVRRNFANRLLLAGAYTLASAWDDSDGVFYVPNNQFDIRDGWAHQSGDQRHTLSVNGSYQLPEGFQISGLYHFGSGSAVATTASGSPFASGGANRTFLSTTKVYNPSQNNHPDPLDSAYEITARNSFYGRPIHRVDFRLQKTFAIKTRYRLIGQAEVFNLLNHSNFGSYQTAVTSSSYGQPAQTSVLSYSPRTIQLAVRFEF